MVKNKPPFKQARLYPSFIEKPLGLLIITLICPPLSLFILLQTVNNTETYKTYKLLGAFFSIFLMIVFVFSLIFNIVFLINNRRFKKLEANHDLMWTLSEDKWVKFWEMNYELEKKYALAVLIYNLWLAPIILIAFGFTFYTIKSFGDDHLILPFSILFATPLILIFMIPLAFRYRSKRLLKRAQRGNVSIYLNHGAIYINGNLLFLKQFYSDTELKILHKPIPYIEITRSIHQTNYRVLLFEKLLSRFIDKKYLRAANVTRIPLPEDEKMIEQISAIMNLDDPNIDALEQLISEGKIKK